MNIRSVCSSAAAALGIGWSAWSKSALAGTVFVHAAYVPVTVFCPPPRPVYAPPPAYVVRASVTGAGAATEATVPSVRTLPYAAVPIPVTCGVVVPATVSVGSVVYAQPVRNVAVVTSSAAAPR